MIQEPMQAAPITGRTKGYRRLYEQGLIAGYTVQGKDREVRIFTFYAKTGGNTSTAAAQETDDIIQTIFGRKIIAA